MTDNKPTLRQPPRVTLRILDAEIPTPELQQGYTMTGNTKLPVSIAIVTSCHEGEWVVDLRVTGLKNEEQARAAENHLIRTLCGQEIKAN